MDAAAAAAAERTGGSVRALHCLQKLMGRPDADTVFAEFDTDGDGTVSRRELELGFAKLGETLGPAELDAMMGLLDSDGDGGVSYAEFVHMGKVTKDLAGLELALASGLAEVRPRFLPCCLFHSLGAGLSTPRTREPGMTGNGSPLPVAGGRHAGHRHGGNRVFHRG